MVENPGIKVYLRDKLAYINDFSGMKNMGIKRYLRYNWCISDFSEICIFEL